MSERKDRTSRKTAESRRNSGTKGERKAHPSGSQRGEKKSAEFHPAGIGGPAQDAGGPEHHGAEAYEDRNP